MESRFDLYLIEHRKAVRLMLLWCGVMSLLGIMCMLALPLGLGKLLKPMAALLAVLLLGLLFVLSIVRLLSELTTVVVADKSVQLINSKSAERTVFPFPEIRSYKIVEPKYGSGIKLHLTSASFAVVSPLGVPTEARYYQMLELLKAKLDKAGVTQVK